MKRKKLVILSFYLASLSTNVSAYFETGNDLYSKLGDWKAPQSTNIISASTSIGYITGVWDALEGITFCSPGNVTKSQLADVVYNYLRDNPQIRHKEGYILVSGAYRQAFPCPNRR